MSPIRPWAALITLVDYDMQSSPRRSDVLSLEEYERFRDEPGYRSEVSRGMLVREPQPGAWHGEVTGRLYTALDSFVRAHGLGKVTNQTGFPLSEHPPPCVDRMSRSCAGARAHRTARELLAGPTRSGGESCLARQLAFRSAGESH